MKVQHHSTLGLPWDSGLGFVLAAEEDLLSRFMAEISDDDNWGCDMAYKDFKS